MDKATWVDAFVLHMINSAIRLLGWASWPSGCGLTSATSIRIRQLGDSTYLVTRGLAPFRTKPDDVCRGRLRDASWGDVRESLMRLVNPLRRTPNRIAVG